MYMLSFPMLHIFSSKRSRYVFLAWSGGGLVFFPAVLSVVAQCPKQQKNWLHRRLGGPKPFYVARKIGSVLRRIAPRTVLWTPLVLLLGTSRNFDGDGDGKENRFNPCMCITLLCQFLCRSCTTTT